MSVIMEPQIQRRPAQPYAAIRASLAPADLASVLPPLTDEVLTWLAAHGSAPVGPEFWRYLVIDMSAQLTVEVGFPVAEPLEGDDRVVTGWLPGGAYAVTAYHGDPQGITQATSDLLQWAQETGVAWDKRPHGAGEAWASRIEWYLNSGEPDPAAWETELAFRIADAPAAQGAVSA